MTDDLTIHQRIAIEGEVAYALGTAPHEEEMYYRIYMILHTIKPSYREFYVRTFKEALPKEDHYKVDSIVLQITAGEIPVMLWVNRTKADLKHYILGSDFAANIAPWLPVNSKVIKNHIARSAFSRFLKRAFLACPVSTKILCENILEEINNSPKEVKELELVKDMVYMTLKDIVEVEPMLRKMCLEELEPNSSILDISFDPKELLYFDIETEANYDSIKKCKKERVRRTKKGNKLEDFEKEALFGEPTKQDEPSDPYMEDSLIAQAELRGLPGEEIQKAIEDTIAKEQTKVKRKPRAVKKVTRYKVVKKYKNSDITTTIKTFDTEEEANEYIQEILEQYPDITELCDLFLISFSTKKK